MARMLASSVEPTFVLSVILAILVNAAILAAVVGSAGALVWFTFWRPDPVAERVLRCAAMVIGVLLAGGAKAAGISIVGLFGQSVAASIAIPGALGILAGWYLGRFLRHSDRRAEHVLIFVASFTVLAFTDVYTESLRSSGFTYGRAILPNVAFLLAMGLYAITQYRAETIQHVIEYLDRALPDGGDSERGARPNSAEGSTAVHRVTGRDTEEAGLPDDSGRGAPLASVISHGRSLASRANPTQKASGTYQFGERVGVEPVAREVGERLRDSGVTLVAAESCTGGLLSGVLTDLPGSSKWFRGGIVADSNDVKREQLGVSEQVLQAHGAVSAQTAQAMAEGVRERLGGDLGVSVTGTSGAEMNPTTKEPAMIYVWLDSLGAAEGRRFAFDGDGSENRWQAVQEVLRLVLERVTLIPRAEEGSSS